MICDNCIHNTETNICYNQNEIANIEEWIEQFGCREFDSKSNYQKVIHSKWEFIGTMYGTLLNCPICRHKQREYGNYCTNCGSKMDMQ